MDELISRQAAIKDAESWVAVDGCEKHMQKNVVEWLKEFPSAQPKKGKWIIKDDTEKFIAQCNCCRYIEDSRRINNFCPHCGAEMRKVTK